MGSGGIIYIKKIILRTTTIIILHTCVYICIYIYMILELSYCSKGDREKAGKRERGKR